MTKANRRGHGEGSIHRRKSDGRWVGVLDLGIIDGKRKRKYAYGDTQKAVRDRLSELQRARSVGLPTVDDRRTVSDYLNWWATESIPHRLRPTTVASYQDQLRRHIVPAIGHLRLSRLSPADVQTFLTAKLDAGLSPRTVQYLHAILRSALSQAERFGFVVRNVAGLVEPPRGRRQEIVPFDPDQARALLDAATDDRLYALYSVAVAIGLRRGEALGLRWSDVDLSAGTLRVSQTLLRAGREPVFSEPKTSRSRRSITLPTICVDALRSHRVRQHRERLAAGDDWRDLGLVFTTRLGSPVEPRNLTRAFAALCRDAGLPAKRFHDLRHTCASLLLAQNVHPRVVMEILGHSGISVTMDLYSHVLPALHVDAANHMESLLTATDG